MERTGRANRRPIRLGEPEGYKNASPETRKFFNHAFLDGLLVKDTEIVGVTHAEPFRTCLDPEKIRVSDKRLLVERIGRYSNRIGELFGLIRSSRSSRT